MALGVARDNGYEVIPTCPFVRHLLEEHSEYDDVLVRKQSRGTSPQRNEAESTQPRQDVSFAC
ncbi:MAG TPA: N-acetyltransferase [Gemmatimonadota bacterium]|nr:N-acetyltransferase [Gemmatimonadota bacterium]